VPSIRQLRALSEEYPAFVTVAGLLVALHLLWPVADWLLRARGVATGFMFYDWGAYGGALERWRAGESLYVRNDDGGFHGSYLYPPVALLVFRPFSALSPHAAAAWVACSFLLLWVGVVAVLERLVGRRSWPERLLVAPLLVGFQPLLFGLKMGQTAAFTAGLLCLAFVALDRDGRASYLSGAATAVVGVVKFAYAPVGAHLLADRRRFAGAVAAGGGLVALSLLLLGVETHRRYLEVLAWGVSQGGAARSPASWLPGYYRPLGWFDGALVVRVVGSLLVAGAALCARDADRETFALGVAAFPLLTPLAYTYYLVALVPAALVLIHGELVRDGRPAVPTLGLLLVSVHAYGLLAAVGLAERFVPVVASTPELLFALQPGLWGNLLLAGTAAFRVGERVERPSWLPASAPVGG
jgi:hypothetical protein